MPQPVILIRVFVASPIDAGAERDALKSVTDQINHTVALARGVQNFSGALGSPSWIWRRYASGGKRPDDFSSIDLFIGILWKKFGTPTKRGDSGSAEEFEQC